MHGPERRTEESKDNYTNMTVQDIKMTSISYNETSSVLFEVPSELYKHVTESKFKLYVGHQICKVYDIKCAELHKTSDCVNVTKSIAKYKTNLETNYLSMDRNLWTILKKKVNRYIDTTDYPMRPTLSTANMNMAFHQQKHFYLMGSNNTLTRFRVLKIDRMEPRELLVMDDKIEYTQYEIRDLVKMIDMGNRNRVNQRGVASGVTKIVSSFGIIVSVHPSSTKMIRV
ncbi:hypothetical protein TSAR_015040 [Trichomalopsis sarcophagae]|uniref:Uncharacterized protein n=1 Tax=Trichomalopsis sarcophagae TaxID=543379 RepID=A0A232F8Q3_9HYME|nr:hypothetical protein TSAR_015040 [Trichomalopsis sarcophagae]